MTLSVKFEESLNMAVKFLDNLGSFSVDIEGNLTVNDLEKLDKYEGAFIVVSGGSATPSIPSTPGIEVFTGPYEVTPTIKGFKMDTAEKYMPQDVKVKAIPFSDVSNIAGGTTVYIADAVE